jgi:hypothetical protein
VNRFPDDGDDEVEAVDAERRLQQHTSTSTSRVGPSDSSDRLVHD